MTSSSPSHPSQIIRDLEEAGNLRKIPDVDHGSRLYMEYRGQKVLNLASNNYLGLAGSTDLVEASVQAVRDYGTSSAASRLISGNYRPYNELERMLAQFKQQPGAMAVGSGFAANLCILGALAGRGSVIFSDRLNHASILDAAVLSRAGLVRYRHKDVDHLNFLLDRYRERPSKILVTDTVFSMDGDMAPLFDIVELCKKHHVTMVVDEAHATGVLGHGRGLAHHLGLDKDIQVHMGTFSKALGSYGGYIASSQDIIDLIINRGRAFIYSTALPPAVIGASLAGLEAVMKNPEQGRSLLDMAAKVRGFLHRLGLDTGSSTTQIIPVILKKSRLTLKAWQILVDQGLFTGAIRPPTVPDNTARLRLCLRCDLGEADLTLMEKAFVNMAGELGIFGQSVPERS